MKKNNKGFIAISLIYSFFLVFLVTLLMILANYAHNRVLLSSVKKETQNYLNNLAEFNPVNLENKTYAPNEEVNLASNTWKVLEDLGDSVKIILSRNLTEQEISIALTSKGIYGAYSGNTTLMCLNSYNPLYCNFDSATTFNEYRWNTSLVKIITDYWLENSAILQKAVDTGNLIRQNFSDGKITYNDYIRIPMSSEYVNVNDTNIWYITFSYRANGVSYLTNGMENLSSHSTFKGIRPVIVIKKAS